MSSPGGKPAKTVLVVEDNPGDARLVSLYLEEQDGDGFVAIVAETLAAALDVLAARPVDAVLLDLSLPDSFGVATLEKLRAAQPFVPVVVLTGNDDHEVALAALRRGAQDFLVKGQGDGDLVRRSVRYAIERSRVGLELRRSEAQFRAVFANAGLGVILVAADGRIMAANRAFAAMVGHGAEDVNGTALSSLLHADDIGRHDSLFGDLVAATHDNFQMLSRFVGREGGVAWGRVTVTAVRDTDADTLRFAVVVVEDVTERKRLEDDMRLAATVFESTGEGLFITDSEQRIIRINPAFSDITGYEADEVLGRTPGFLASGRHGRDFYGRMWHAIETQGRWQGEIWDRRKNGETFVSWQNIAAVRDAEGEVTNYVGVMGDITSSKQIEERLSYAANHDPLTRLPNRNLFQERLSRALARAHRNRGLVAVMFVDLDRFKEVNDTLGHLAGDRLLQQVAERISASIRQGDTVARLSGDEFTVMLEDVEDPRDAALVAHKVLKILSEPFHIGSDVVKISSSIGVSIYPMDAADSQSLVRLADAAMYRAKQQGRNAYRFHSETVNAQAFERLALEEALDGALARGEFEVHYQPVFDLATGRVASIEALLRWNHPDVGLLAPSQFLPLVEEDGLIQPIGQWLLETACRQTHVWHGMGFEGLELEVNLSGRQLRQTNFLEMIGRVLGETGMPPERLLLEIPEGTAVDRVIATGAVFNGLARLGVHVAIDEFGAGYSSLAFLRHRPPAALKISQSFVRSASASTEDAEIVTAIVGIARGLRMAVVAPGIETEEQLALMVASGCDRVQGFLLARPMSAAAMTDYLASREIPGVLSRRVVT